MDDLLGAKSGYWQRTLNETGLPAESPKMKIILRAIAIGIFGGFCFAASSVFAYTLINWTSEMTNQMFLWVGVIFADISPILLVIVPIILVAAVIGFIFNRFHSGGK